LDRVEPELMQLKWLLYFSSRTTRIDKQHENINI